MKVFKYLRHSDISDKSDMSGFVGNVRFRHSDTDISYS